MTASMGGEVQSNRLFGAAPGSTLAGAQAVDGEREDGGDLVEVVGCSMVHDLRQITSVAFGGVIISGR